MNMENTFPTYKRFLLCVNAIFKRTWRISLAVLLLLLVAHGIATLVLWRKVEAEMAKIRANGEPLYSVELAGRPLSDDVNGAVIYEKAFKLIKQENWKQGYSDWDDCDLLSAEKRKDPKAWDNAGRAIATNAKALSLAEEAASKPECRFKTNWKDGSSALFPHYAPLRRLAKLVAIHAIVQAKDGNMAGAVKSTELVIKMCDATKDDAILINQCFRWKLIHMSAATLGTITNYGRITDDQASSLANDFSRIDLGSGFVKAMQGERAMIMTGFTNIQKHPAAYQDLVGSSESPVSNVYWAIYTSYIGRPILYSHKLESLRFMQKQIDISGLTHRKIRQLDLKWLDDSKAGLLSAIVCPVFIGARAGADAAMVDARCSQIFLAIQSYKHHFAKYPASLAELKANVHWNMNTEDPFSGKDIIYKRVGNSFKLYSIGDNFKDDGGVAPNKNSHSTDGDIVFNSEN